MSSDYLERVAAVAHAGDTAQTDPRVESASVEELQVAIASAVNHGEPVAIVAAIADVPTLAVLDALEAQTTAHTSSYWPSPPHKQ